MGHQGVERTSSLVRDRFSGCGCRVRLNIMSCQGTPVWKEKPCRETRAPLTSIVTIQPFELVSVDFLHVDRCSGGYKYVLVITDHFKWFEQAYAKVECKRLPERMQKKSAERGRVLCWKWEIALLSETWLPEMEQASSAAAGKTLSRQRHVSGKKKRPIYEVVPEQGTGGGVQWNLALKSPASM